MLRAINATTQLLFMFFFNLLNAQNYYLWKSIALQIMSSKRYIWCTILCRKNFIIISNVPASFNVNAFKCAIYTQSRFNKMISSCRRRAEKEEISTWVWILTVPPHYLCVGSGCMRVNKIFLCMLLHWNGQNKLQFTVRQKYKPPT